MYLVYGVGLNVFMNICYNFDIRILITELGNIPIESTYNHSNVFQLPDYTALSYVWYYQQQHITTPMSLQLLDFKSMC